jgi:hypothetical protein
MAARSEFGDAVRFRRVCTIAGDVEVVQIVRRNGILVPLLKMPGTAAARQTDRSDLLPLYRELMYGLSRLERRTWVPLLLGRSIEDVAQMQGVSRQAIYARIRGNSKNQGGMIRKNDYVDIWWRTQRHSHSRTKHA